MKKILLLTLLAMFMPLVANAYDAKIDGIYYNFSGSNAEVTFGNVNYNSYSGAIVIPESVTYNGNTYSVTCIGNFAFYNCTSLTSVTIPNSVTSIGEYAFCSCEGLTSITIPNSVTSIGGGAFSSSGLKSVTIPNSVTSIGEYAFSGCSGLTSVTIPNSVTSIGEYAFSGCSGLTSITIPESVTSIGEGAFYNCIGLTSVIIPNSVTSIVWYVFYGCSGLTSVTIPNSVTSIGDAAFYGCSNINNVKVPVTDYSSFCENKALGCIYSSIRKPVHLIDSEGIEIKDYIVPDGVTNIGERAFCNCTRLTSITIPNSVTSIGNSAFYGCSNINNVKVLVTDYSSFCENKALGCIYSSIGKPVQLIDGEGIEIKDFIVPEGVTSIGERAFINCSSLTSITIPNSVTSIGEVAFKGCSGLTSVTIGSGVLSIASDAFYNTSIKKVIWLTNTPPNGYSNVGGTINYVSNNNFSYLSNIQVYPFLSSMFEVNGVKYVPVSPSERTCDAIDCAYNKAAGEMTIPSSVTYQGITLNVMNVMPYFAYGNTNIEILSLDIEGDISDYAFYNCMGMKSVNFGNKTTGIGSYAFSGCEKLEGIVIPDAATSVGDYAFQNCSAMTSVKIGNGVVAISPYAFSGCSALPKIQIPQSVTNISNYVFSGCTGLKTVLMDDGESELNLGSNGNSPLFASCPLDSLYIGRNITYPTASNKGNSPFYRNTTLRSVTITDKETEISTNEFYGCTNLKNVRIGDGVITIGDYAFSGCSSLEGFAFGSSVETIGKEAFSDCTAMTSLISKATTPPTCGTQALDDINKWNCSLTVPEGYLTAYQAVDQWKDFFFIEEGGDNPIIPDPKKCATPTISYVNGKLKFSCETENVLFNPTIKDDDIKSYSHTEEIDLCATYHISVYAQKEDYFDSDVATATLCWIDVEPATEGIVDEDAVTEVKAVPVLIQTQGGNITIQGAAEGTPIAIYGIDGKEYGSATSEKDRTTIATSLRPGSVAVVKIGEKAIKVAIK